MFKCNNGERYWCAKTVAKHARHTTKQQSQHTLYVTKLPNSVKIRFSQQKIQKFKKGLQNAYTEMKRKTELNVTTGADPVLYESETLNGMLVRFVEIKRDQYKFISNSVDGTSSRRCACRISTRSVDTTETVRTHAETRDSF